MYRPQFAFPKASNCQEQRCIYCFDSSNTPSMAGTLAAGITTSRIPLPLDRDADYLVRAIQISPSLLQFGLEDPGYHPLVHPTSSGLPPVVASALWSQCDGGPLVTLESDNWGIYCRRGAVLIAYFSNPTTGALAFPTINIHGIKRFTGAKCQ